MGTTGPLRIALEAERMESLNSRIEVGTPPEAGEPKSPKSAYPRPIAGRGPMRSGTLSIRSALVVFPLHRELVSGNLCKMLEYTGMSPVDIYRDILPVRIINTL